MRIRASTAPTRAGFRSFYRVPVPSAILGGSRDIACLIKYNWGTATLITCPSVHRSSGPGRQMQRISDTEGGQSNVIGKLPNSKRKRSMSCMDVETSNLQTRTTAASMYLDLLTILDHTEE